MARQETWTAKQAAEYLNNKKVADADAPRLKYGNQWVEVDGHKFQSKKEAHYYGQCKMRVLAGQLSRFEMQVEYELRVNDILITTYRADFVLYHPNGTVTVVDCKGKATEHLPEFRIKRNLMYAIHGIIVQIV